jgi:hypothetical protein
VITNRCSGSLFRFWLFWFPNSVWEPFVNDRGTRSAIRSPQALSLSVGTLCQYNDHDTLRADPIFKLVADRSPNERDLVSQPTLSRFENAISIQLLIHRLLVSGGNLAAITLRRCQGGSQRQSARPSPRHLLR